MNGRFTPERFRNSDDYVAVVDAIVARFEKLLEEPVNDELSMRRIQKQNDRRKEENEKLRAMAKERLQLAKVEDEVESQIHYTSEVFENLGEQYVRSIFRYIREARTNGFQDEDTYYRLLDESLANVPESPDGQVLDAEGLFVLNSLYNRTTDSFDVPHVNV
jgi:translation initiation factor 2 alpha subunit (eIF-2alpha)